MRKIVKAAAFGILLAPLVTFAAFNSDLHVGSTGQDVSVLQQFLAGQGLFTGEVTGGFYSLTQNAVKAYQQSNGITPASGYFGPLTRTAVNQALTGQTLSSGEVLGTSVSAAATPATPNYLGYVSYYWGDPTLWAINCDKPFYFGSNTCLPVSVPAGLKQLDGPALTSKNRGLDGKPYQFVAIYANPKTANGTSGLTVQWYRTSATPFSGSPMPNPPSCVIAASSTAISAGQSTQLSWSSTNATSGNVPNVGTGISGSKYISPLQTTTYTAAVSSPLGSGTCSTTISVKALPVPTCSLTATPQTITSGQNTLLAWTSANATSAVIDNGVGAFAASSSKPVSPVQTTTYTATVSGAGGSGKCSATVTVKAPAPVAASIAPASAVVGGLVTIKGAGFTNSNDILFSGTKATTTASTDGATLTFSVPSAFSPGNYSIAVNNANGTSGTLAFTVLQTGDLASSLCIADSASGGHVYALDDHDWFDKDASLSVSDSWPETGGAEWSNQQPVSIWKDKPIKAGRAREGDDAYYPSQQQVADWGIQPVAAIVPGVGLELRSYPVTNPSPAEAAALNPDGVVRHHIAGGLINSKAYTYGYWVYSVQLPGGAPWWPAVWLLNMGAGDYEEIDTEEQWVANSYVSQTYWHDLGTSFGTVGGKYIATSDTAQHTYGALKTPTAVGLYEDGLASSPAYPPSKPEYSWMHPQPVGLNPILSLQSCQAGTWCGASTTPELNATAKMVVKYYAHYSPTATTCSSYDVPPALPQ